MVAVWKDIKPSKLKGKNRLKFLNAMRKVGTKIKKDFGETTKTWDTSVKFTTKVSLKGGGPRLVVDTDNVIYRYVNNGTRRHLIWAGIYTGKSKKKALAFQGSYKAKTKPGVIGSTAGGSSGKTVLRPYVRHPGTEARRFNTVIAKKWQPRFKAEMQKVMHEIREESGHAI